MLYASDQQSGTWTDRVGNLRVIIPSSATFESEYVRLTGTALSVPLKTNPNILSSVTYVVRFRVSTLPTNQGWVMSQSPDYGWSRAITINDNRLGYVGQTPGSFDSSLGKIAVDSWNILIGTWTQNGNCQTWLNGIAGKVRTCSNGGGSNANEALIIGGRLISDNGYNPTAIDISHALVYNRAITQDDIVQIQSALSGKMHFLLIGD